MASVTATRPSQFQKMVRNYGPPAVAFSLAATGCFGTLALLGLGAGAAYAAKSLAGRCKKQETPAATPKPLPPKQQATRRFASRKPSTVIKDSGSPSTAVQRTTHSANTRKTGASKPPVPAVIKTAASPKPTALSTEESPPAVVAAPEAQAEPLASASKEEPSHTPVIVAPPAEPLANAPKEDQPRTSVVVPVPGPQTKPLAVAVSAARMDSDALLKSKINGGTAAPFGEFVIPVSTEKEVVEEETIELEDPKYHPRDLRLDADEQQAVMNLNDEMERAQKALEKQEIPNPDISRRFDFGCVKAPICSIEVDKPKTLNSGTVVYGASAQGYRPEMEDEHFGVEGVVLLADGTTVPYEAFAVFDGHGGKQTATYAKDHFQMFFEDEVARRNPDGLTYRGMRNAFKAAFVRLDEQIKRQYFYKKDGEKFKKLFQFRDWETLFLSLSVKNLQKPLKKDDVKAMVLNKIRELPAKEQLQWTDSIDHIMSCLEEDSGSTAVVSVRIGRKLWTANIGDARAVVLIDGKMEQLSVDAKPTFPKTKPELVNGQPKDENRFSTSIFKRGGGVGYGRRVNGNLATARALNDKTLTSDPDYCPEEYGTFTKGQYYVVVARPKITLKTLRQGAKVRLCLACDGLWDVCTTPMVKPMLEISTTPAFRLVNGALHGGSLDNVSVVVAEMTV